MQAVWVWMMKTSPPPPARAREKPTMEQMRQHIADMMIRREWQPGVSHKQLADEWGVAVRTVSDRALEASRAITMSVQVKDWVQQSMAELDSMQALALAEVKLVCVGKDQDTKELIYERMPQPNVRAAAYCIELKAKMLGAFAPTKTQQVEQNDIERMSREEKIAAHKQALAELEAEEKVH